MKNCIKTELWKATHDKMFLLSLLLGLIVCIIQVVQVSIDVNALIPGILSDAETGRPSGYTGISIFFNWIGIDGYYFGSRLFFFLWSVFVALPFGWSYAKERKDGVYNQIVTRCGTKQYFIAKYLAVFTTGGLALVIPVLLNLLILAMFCPYDVLDILSGALYTITTFCPLCSIQNRGYMHWFGAGFSSYGAVLWPACALLQEHFSAFLFLRFYFRLLPSLS